MGGRQGVGGKGRGEGVGGRGGGEKEWEEDKAQRREWEGNGRVGGR